MFIMYPKEAKHYILQEEIGSGVSASVYRALCIPLHEIVAIKILDFEGDEDALKLSTRESQIMTLQSHPNVVRSYCSFANDHTLWVVMPYMEGGSCLHLLKAAQPDGFEEVVIATILHGALKGLEYLHCHGHIHRDFKAGNILIDARGGVRLSDFGVSVSIIDSPDKLGARRTFTGTPCWMPPEVLEGSKGYDWSADIWSFGITAMELASGHAPFSKYPPAVLLMMLHNAPHGFGDYNKRGKKFSNSFKQMIASCLVKNPSKRPSTRRLLTHPFFKQARSSDYLVRTILDGLPLLTDRLRELKRKDDIMLAQKRISFEQREEISQYKYTRGIICDWNFDIEDFQAQPSQVRYVLPVFVPSSIQFTSDSSSDSSMNALEKKIFSAILETEVNGKSPDDMADMLSHNSSTPSKASAAHNSYEPDEKAKGRFKVTTENVDFQKVASPLHKRQSVPAISQHVAAAAAAVALSTRTNQGPPNAPNHSLYPISESLLQNYILEREDIFLLMEQIVTGHQSFGDGCTPSNTAASNNPFLTSFHGRPEDLLRELTVLQRKLLCNLEKLQKNEKTRRQNLQKD